MILGIGIDLVDSRRIKKLMGQHPIRFIEKYFTAHEAAHVQQYEDIDQQALSLAKRFAAKEACAKALGTGIQDGVTMKGIAITNDSLGKPFLTLSDGALDRMMSMAAMASERADGEGKQPVIHLSMTDEPPYAQAQVLIEIA